MPIGYEDKVEGVIDQVKESLRKEKESGQWRGSLVSHELIGGDYMYIGLGTLVVILVIIAIIFLVRRA